MSASAHKITRQDCREIVGYLAEALKKSGLGDEVDFIVYGSYLETWRDGVSDLDGIFYFRTRSPLHPSIRPHISTFQTLIALLYEQMPFLEPGKYIYDLFILDSFHGADGRFVIFDKEFIGNFRRWRPWELVHGSCFFDQLRPVSFRNQNEFELAVGLHKLRNYLLFEIPHSPSAMSPAYAKAVLHFLKVLPMDVAINANEPGTKDPSVLERMFAHIDYRPLQELRRCTADPDAQEACLKAWHEPGNTQFIDCVSCYELTLNELVSRFPMQSRHA